MVDSNPDVPSASSSKTPLAGVKAARPDIIEFETPIDAGLLNTILIENLGGQELINIARHDLISGQRIDYQPVRGISRSGSDGDALSLVSLQGTSDTVFNNFSIRLEDKIPYTKQPVEIVNNEIVVNVVNLEVDERVEVQIVEYGYVLDGTIYEEEL